MREAQPKVRRDAQAVRRPRAQGDRQGDADEAQNCGSPPGLAEADRTAEAAGVAGRAEADSAAEGAGVAAAGAGGTSGDGTAPAGPTAAARTWELGRCTGPFSVSSRT